MVVKTKRTRLQTLIKRKTLKTVWQYFLLLIGTVTLIITLRVFLFASFKIPSPSMDPALIAGDYIIVNKLIPGPRIFKSLNFKDNVETRRFNVGTVERNDVLVFNFPYIDSWNKIKMDVNKNYVKRCVAIPGDIFYIEDGIYKVKNVSDTLGCYMSQSILSQTRDETLIQQEGIYNTFPFDTIHYHWNIKNFGPLYIPKVADKIDIDTLNIVLYKNVIEYETNEEITLKEGAVFLGSIPLKEYTFQMNYYFMTGDKVLDSQDSRYWGLLPEDHIIGKAAFIWKSKDMNSDQYRFERFFKSIH